MLDENAPQISVGITDAVLRTGISRSALYKLINQGRLTPRKFGRRTLILWQELEHLIHELPQGLGDEPEGPKNLREK